MIRARAAAASLAVLGAAAVVVCLPGRARPAAPPCPPLTILTDQPAAVTARIEVAAQQLHARRHRAGTAPVCGRCRTDACIVAATVLGTRSSGGGA